MVGIVRTETIRPQSDTQPIDQSMALKALINDIWNYGLDLVSKVIVWN